MIAGAGEESRRIGGVAARGVTWLAWSLAVLAVTLLVGGVILSSVAGSAVSGPNSGGETGDSSVAADLLTLLPFAVVGAIIASRHPRNTIGWLFCGVGVTIGLNSFAGDYVGFWLSSGIGGDRLGETAAWLSSWLWILLVYVPASLLLLLFPDGRLPSPRWWPVACGVILGTAGGVAGFALEAGPLADFPQIANPYGVGGPVPATMGVTGSIVAAGSMVASALSLIMRLRRASSEQRQQIKWLAYGGALVVIGVCAGGLIIPRSVSVSILIMSFSLLGLPIFTGIAIVRHRLYDIDLVINRTLVYASLTALLVLIYVGAVTGTQAAFQALTGQTEPPTLAIVASTLVIAALVNPLRRRVQLFVDRRFYRRKYDAAKILETFSTGLRGARDLGALGDDLVGVVNDTMQPRHAGLWLRPLAPPAEVGTEERLP